MSLCAGEERQVQRRGLPQHLSRTRPRQDRHREAGYGQQTGSLGVPQQRAPHAQVPQCRGEKNRGVFHLCSGKKNSDQLSVKVYVLLMWCYFSKGTHPGFRIMFSSDPSQSIPVSILDRCIKLSSDPPSGLKANLKQVHSIDC